MSFILNDQQLLDQLIKCGQDYEYRFTKEGQAAMSAGQTILRLLNSLESQLGVKEPSPEQNIPDMQVMDNLPQQIDSRNTNQTGDKQLTFGAVKSREDFNNWLSTNGITVDGKKLGPGFNYQALLQMIQQRAKAKVTYSPNRDVTALNTIYQKQIESIAPSFVGPDGKTPVKLDGTIGSQQQAGQGQAAPNQMTFIADTARRLPFNADYIDLNRIKEFANSYAAIANNPQVSQQAQTVLGNINQLATMMNNPGSIIYMNETNLSVSGFKMLSKQPNGQIVLVTTLYNLMMVSGQLFKTFTQEFASEVNANAGVTEDVVRALQAQTEPGGPIHQNLGSLMDLRNQLNADWKQQGSKR